MSSIEQKIDLFLEKVCIGQAAFSEDIIQEFGERCKKALRESFVEKQESRRFYLRMSNIGRPLRQLMLQKQLGKHTISKDFKLRATMGYLYEAFMIALLKESGVNIQDHDKQVSLDVLGTTINGTYDVKIDDKVYDIKTASPYSYDYKFKDLASLMDGDGFGYLAQGFGYAAADKSPFGGWIVLNKATGAFKVLEIPEADHDTLFKKYLQEIKATVFHVTNDLPIPACTGIVDEYFRTKPTGNKVLSSDCTYCDYKQHCHEDLQCLPEVFSKALTRKIKYYVGNVCKPKDE